MHLLHMTFKPNSYWRENGMHIVETFDRFTLEHPQAS